MLCRTRPTRLQNSSQIDPAMSNGLSHTPDRAVTYLLAGDVYLAHQPYPLAQAQEPIAQVIDQLPTRDIKPRLPMMKQAPPK